MKPTSLDLSANRDFAQLATIVAGMQAAAPIAFILIGATARDVMLKAHGQESPRATEDVDFAFMVEAWEEFDTLRAALLASGEFSPDPKKTIHKLRHAPTGYKLDLVPFGAIEDGAREVTLPPESGIKFDCFGIREAYEVRVQVTLPGQVLVQAASIPALAVLKLAAFHDRKRTAPGKDASDLLVLARKHLDCGNMDRFFEEHADLAGGDFDTDIASAQLLARDIAGIVSPADLGRLIGILAPEIDPDGALTLVNQTNTAGIERALAIFTALTRELQVRVQVQAG
ncbi:MAG TPA: nucleotidyl transferase AbiEii/AbiGii toxin family protein [Burkholderiales bacterium]